MRSVTCVACGGKVREGRVQCLRCGAPLVAQPEPRRVVRAWLPTAILAGCVAVSGVAFISARTSAERASGSPAVVIGSAALANVEGAAPDSVTRTPSLRTPAAHLARESSREGVQAYSAGDTAAATEAFAEAIEADPQNAEALNNLGQALVRVGRASDAIQYFDRAIAIDAGIWAFHFNRARAHGEMKNWPLAIRDYRAAVRLFPDDYATHYNLAKALQANRDLTAAVAAFQRAIDLAPGHADFHLSLGLALEAAGRPRDAAAAYRRYLDLQPSSPDAEKIKGQIARLEGRTP